MRALVVYSSKTGNTLKVARVIAKALRARLLEVGKAKISDVERADIAGFGSGIYALRFDSKLRKFIYSLPKVKNKRAFIFFTSGSSWTARIKSVVRLLKKKGFAYAGKFSCRGFDAFGPLKLIGGINKGRPNKKDLEEAANFAKKLLGHAPRKP